MTKEEQKNILNQLLTSDSQADRSGLLTNLESDYSAMLGELETLRTENEALKTDNANFAKVNNDLFMRVGASFNNHNDSSNHNDNNEDNHEPKRSYDDLFKEGEL